MQQTVESNRTMLVDGPASARLVSGKAEVFGCLIKVGQRVIVREGKRLPFFAVEKSVLDVSLGANASAAETLGGTIPQSWSAAVETILGLQRRPVVVVILGSADCGKSSLSTYLLNSLIDGKCKAAVLDGDLGQSDIGPSATVGYALASKCVADLYDLKLKNAFFVGVTSPIAALPKTVEGLTAMKAEILQQQVDFVLVNTDGWVSGDIAIRYKTALIDALKPDFIVGVQEQGELVPLIANLEVPVTVVEPSVALNPRTVEKRKILREMTYARYLKHAKLQCYPKSQVTIEPRNAIPQKQEPEKGILLGIYGRGNRFLGIGVLRMINPVRKVLKVQTAVSAKPQRIVIGKVVVNQKLQEVQD
ncbi:MAG TPA: Clp1/GlmU family protein [Candidatus Binatia bacterium]|nr:Clp1/GlmU family protein [Candidatus Binatia bacterium]